MECELCGSNNANRKTEIGEAILTVCPDCVKFGKPVANVEIKREVKKLELPKEMNQMIKEDIAEIVKKEREKRNMTQEQLASKIRESHNVIKRIEEGWRPSFKIVKKLEKMFKINLIEEIPEVEIKSKKNSEGLSLGDFMKK